MCLDRRAPAASSESEETTCLIAGGGPAGMMLGLLLARAGVKVTVMEKRADFLRDFRGDTVHASTLRLLVELGLGPRFTQLPHPLIDTVRTEIHNQPVNLDLTRLSRRTSAHSPGVAVGPPRDGGHRRRGRAQFRR